MIRKFAAPLFLLAIVICAFGGLFTLITTHSMDWTIFGFFMFSVAIYVWLRITQKAPPFKSSLPLPEDKRVLVLKNRPGDTGGAPVAANDPDPDPDPKKGSSSKRFEI